MDIENDERELPTLIKAYGEFWNPNAVNWGDSWRLMGHIRRAKRSGEVNVYEQRGIYVLYKEYEPVYVGKALRQSIGYRLQSHRKSIRKGPRWDTFSWFGLCEIADNMKLKGLPKSNKLTSPTDSFIGTLEALLITIVSPKLNSRRERFRGAKQLYQSLSDAPKEISERLEMIENSLDQVLAKLAG